MSHIFNWKEDHFICEFFENVDIYDVQNAIGEISSNSRSDYINYGIIDFTKIETFNIDKKDVAIPAAYDIGFSFSIKKTVKFAFVVTDVMAERFVQNYKKMVDEINSKLKIKIFNSLESAKEWIHM